MISVLVLTILGGCYGWWLFNRYRKVWKYIEKLPGPQTLPILGNLHQAGATPAEFFINSSIFLKKFKYNPYRAYAGFQPYIITTKLRHVEALLTSKTVLHKADFYKFFIPWLGRGLISSVGDQYWATHRKIITPSLNFQNLQAYMYNMLDASTRFMTLLSKYEMPKGMFDVQPVSALYTLDIIYESALGIRLNSIDGGQSPIVLAMDDIRNIIERRIRNILKRSDFWFYFTYDYWLQQRALKVLREEFSRIITQRRNALEAEKRAGNANTETKSRRMNFLDILLTAQWEGKPLSDQEVFEEVSTFIFAGNDTSAAALCFTMYCLSRHPEVQQKAFEEQQAILGDDLERDPTFQEVNDMKYLDMVMKEVLRLFPSAPTIGRYTTEHVNLGGDLQIPPNTTVVIPLICLGHYEEYFENALEFRPERFDKNEQGTKPYAYVPFSAGPRSCIGQKFATLEIKTVTSRLLRTYKLLPAVDGLSSGINALDKPLSDRNPYDVVLAAPITLRSENGVYMRLERRRQ